MTVERPALGFRLAVGAAALTALALVVVGGAVRVSESGLGCPDWPLCDGRLVPEARSEPIVEYAHRATAGVTVLALVVATAWALLRYRRRTDILAPLLASVALVPVQALLGAVVVWLELPDRLVGVHFMVGMVMLALCVYACVAAWRGGAPVSGGFVRLATATGATALLLVSLGAGVVATDALHACGEQWPGCNGGIASGDATAVLQAVHRAVAYAVAGLAIALLVLGVRKEAPLVTAAAPAALVAFQLGVGIAMVLSSHESLLHDVLRILHVAGAAFVWTAAVAAVAVAHAPLSGPPVVGAERRRVHPDLAPRPGADELVVSRLEGAR